MAEAPVTPLRRPPAGSALLLVVGVLGTSTAAPLIKATVAPSLAIAFWRMAMASGVVVPYAAWRRAEGRMSSRNRWLSVGAGVLLAGHFGCFIPAVSLTTVASAVALVAMQPAWAALILHLRGERMAGQAWLGVGLAIGGALLLSGVDVTVSGRALAGDVLALVGGALAAAYRVVGADVRRTVSTTAYTAVCYPVAAVALLIVCVVSSQSLGGYAGSTWLRLAALALLAQILGHSVFNLVLRTVSPTIVSVALLFEIVGAAALAAIFLGQDPPAAAIPAAAVIALGTFLVIRSSERAPAVSGSPPVD
ncbi:MAG TPA: DMT family transporter [Acidimicrobiales bacterium]|nr:DMT family transporter [Acidimicrobiales bacterium]